MGLRNEKRITMLGGNKIESFYRGFRFLGLFLGFEVFGRWRLGGFM